RLCLVFIRSRSLHHSLYFHSLFCVVLLLSPFSFFFFNGFVAHRDLHSFPTRRSSDLARLLGEHEHHLVARVDPGVVVVVVARRGDRKSTRLNSSHQIISYAVFCLKKKKTRSPSLRRYKQQIPSTLINT